MSSKIDWSRVFTPLTITFTFSSSKLKKRIHAVTTSRGQIVCGAPDDRREEKFRYKRGLEIDFVFDQRAQWAKNDQGGVLVLLCHLSESRRWLIAVVGE